MSRLMVGGALAGALALAGCGAAKQAATLTANDVTTAQSIATAGGDATGAKCWGSMLPIAQAVESGRPVGLATATELYRAAMLQAEGPCAPIVLPILVKLGPLLGIAGTLAALPVISPVAVP